jgi:glycine cleavage system H protein
MYNMIKYSKSHEYVRLVDNNEAYIGISNYAQSELGEIVFVEYSADCLQVLQQEECFGSIEAVKTVSDLFSPVECEILEINETINDTPEVINEDAENSGWLLRVKLLNPEQLNDLMDLSEYQEFCK